MQQTKQQPLFRLGQIVATPGALTALEKGRTDPDGVPDAPRFAAIGASCARKTARKNQLSLERGFRLLSSYRTNAGDAKLYVITEADRSVTTILLPEEY